MTPIALLQELINSQKKEGVKTGDWHDLVMIVEPDTHSTGTIVSIPSVYIGFCFDEYGNFKGIFNYKD
jgi:hypothetical protein